MISLLLPFTANALSATTAKTIKGTEPYFNTALTDEIIAESFSLLGFEFGGVDYDDSNVKSLNINPSLYSPSTLKAALTAKVMRPAAGQALDTDGDSNFTLLAKTALDIKLYSGTTEIPTTNTQNFCDLADTYPSPYSIKINGDLSLGTQYGDPPNKDYTVSTAETLKQPIKQYTLSLAGICNIRPASMAVFSGTVDASAANSKYPYQSATNPGGYNSDKWQLGTLSGTGPSIQTGGGFKRNSGFPKTAFKGAKFSLIGSGSDQSKFKCNSPSSDVTLSTEYGAGTDCTVAYKTTLTAKPTSDIVINMEYNNNGTWVTVDSYLIESSQIILWAQVPASTASYPNPTIYKATGSLADGIFPAANTCAGTNLGSISIATASNYFFSRKEFSNSPNILSPTTVGGRFSRDVDGTFMGDWGQLATVNKTTEYTGSGFDQSEAAWTQGSSGIVQSTVGVYNGFFATIQWNVPSTGKRLVVCKQP